MKPPKQHEIGHRASVGTGDCAGGTQARELRLVDRPPYDPAMAEELPWWASPVIYQVHPLSFADSTALWVSR